MLDYAKVILPKVSFSRELFRKELAKCAGWVEPEDQPHFREWCEENFGDMYPEILKEVLSTIAA